MTVNEFIKEQADVRAEAAAKLSDELEINGVRFRAGCDNEGIQVYGIEKLAMILDHKIEIEPYGEKYATYFFHHNDTRFYEHRYDVSYNEIMTEQVAEEQDDV